MKTLLTILMSLSFIVHAAQMNPVSFDEDFGYTNVFFAGKCFKDIKANKISEMSGSDDFLFKYCYRLKPESAEAKCFKRNFSIGISREILKSAGITLPEPSRQEKYYTVTGQKLLSINNLHNIDDTAFNLWYDHEMEAFYEIIFKEQERLWQEYTDEQTRQNRSGDPEDMQLTLQAFRARQRDFSKKNDDN